MYSLSITIQQRFFRPKECLLGIQPGRYQSIPLSEELMFPGLLSLAHHISFRFWLNTYLALAYSILVRLKLPVGLPSVIAYLAFAYSHYASNLLPEDSRCWLTSNRRFLSKRSVFGRDSQSLLLHLLVCFASRASVRY